jgi:multidrug efflux pump subunit AcrA (membrane-fusion protein)
MPTTLAFVAPWESSRAVANIPREPRDNVVVLLLESVAKGSSLPWHRQKLVVLLSSMQHLAASLEAAGYRVAYRNAPSYAEGIAAAAIEFQAAKVVATEGREQDMVDELDRARYSVRQAIAALDESSAQVQEAIAAARVASAQAKAAEAGVIEAQATLARSQSNISTASATAKQAQAAVTTAKVELSRLLVRAPIAGTVLQVEVRKGEFAPSSNAALIQLGLTNPLHVRVEIDEEDAQRVTAGASAEGSLRGDARKKFPLRFIRLEPLARPKQNLAGGAERVDTRVIQAVYALDASANGLAVGQVFIGQQMDVFVRANPARSTQPAAPVPSKSVQP